MSVLTQLTVPGEARSLKIAPEAIYTSSFKRFKENETDVQELVVHSLFLFLVDLPDVISDQYYRHTIFILQKY